MREIKFRVWDLDNKEWYHSPQLVIRPYSGSVTDGATTPNVALSQCTGLKDKHGKEIYEGDIISRENTYENNCVVKWDDESCGFTLNYIYFDESYNMNEFWDDFEVIGNIYENPELLEV